MRGVGGSVQEPNNAWAHLIEDKLLPEAALYRCHIAKTRERQLHCDVDCRNLKVEPGLTSGAGQVWGQLLSFHGSKFDVNAE